MCFALILLQYSGIFSSEFPDYSLGSCQRTRELPKDFPRVARGLRHLPKDPWVNLHHIKLHLNVFWQDYAVQNLDLYYDTESQWPLVYSSSSNLTSCRDKESVLQVYRQSASLGLQLVLQPHLLQEQGVRPPGPASTKICAIDRKLKVLLFLYVISSVTIQWPLSRSTVTLKFPPNGFYEYPPTFSELNVAPPVRNTISLERCSAILRNGSINKKVIFPKCTLFTLQWSF